MNNTNDKKLIIGLVGLMCSGKGTISEYMVQKYQASTYRFSSILRDVLVRLHVDITRHHMIDLSTNLRKTFGEDLLAKVIANDVKSDEHIIISVDGIRRAADIKYLRQIPGFALARVVASPGIRYQRLVKRMENEGDITKSYEEFLSDHDKETEISIPPIMDVAEHEIDNEGDLEQLYASVDELIEKLKK